MVIKSLAWRGRWIGTFLLLGGVAMPLGCTSRDALPGGGTSTMAGDVASRQAELPADKVTSLCLATARELEKNGYDGEAIVQYEKARQSNPRLPQVAWRLAVLYDRQGHDDEALAEYDKALKEQPHKAELLNDMGYFHAQRGHWDEAEKWFRQAVAKSPAYQRAWVNLGKVQAEQGRYKEAFDAFVKVVPPAAADHNIGVILAKQGKADLARAAFRQALEINPELRQSQALLAALDRPASAPATAEFAAATATNGPR